MPIYPNPEGWNMGMDWAGLGNLFVLLVFFYIAFGITYKVAVTRDEKEALLEKSAQGSLGQAVGGATITSLTSSMER